MLAVYGTTGGLPSAVGRRRMMMIVCTSTIVQVNVNRLRLRGPAVERSRMLYTRVQFSKNHTQLQDQQENTCEKTKY